MDNIIKNLHNYQKKKQGSINSMKNGRVDISGKYENNHRMPLFSEETNGIEEYNTHSIAHAYEGTRSQFAFFSKINITHLQKLLKYHVWLQSDKKHLIGYQDPNQLIIIMKSIYLQYGQNNEVDIRKQTKRLNAFVLEYAVPNILLNIEQNKAYKKSVSNLPKPMDLPKYISSAGTRTNPNIIY
jgi:hypothetical protein